MIQYLILLLDLYHQYFFRDQMLDYLLAFFFFFSLSSSSSSLSPSSSLAMLSVSAVRSFAVLSNDCVFLFFGVIPSDSADIIDSFSSSAFSSSRSSVIQLGDIMLQGRRVFNYIFCYDNIACSNY
mmetsp:Transcript_4871/g.6039  ORF Transcript_4871/g.6039 Transcript_4871/m.6039 type:complete len:125 (+) Transcript_4871:1422-1796(+)